MFKEPALLFCIFMKSRSNNSFELLTTHTETTEIATSCTLSQTTVGACFRAEYSCATEYKFLAPPEALIPLCSLSTSWNNMENVQHGSCKGRRSNHSSIYTNKAFCVLLWSNKSKSLFYRKDVFLCWQEITCEL